MKKEKKMDNLKLKYYDLGLEIADNWINNCSIQRGRMLPKFDQ